MISSILAAKQFVNDLDRLNASVRKQFDRAFQGFCCDPWSKQLKTEKLHARVGRHDVFSCRVNDGDRFIWTQEFSVESPILRLIGAHDVTYRRAEKMRPLRVDKAGSFIPERAVVPAKYGNGKPAETVMVLGEWELALQLETKRKATAPAIALKDVGTPVRRKAETLALESDENVRFSLAAIDREEPSSASVAESQPIGIKEIEIVSVPAPEEEPEVYRFSLDDFQALLRGDIASWMLFLAPEHRSFVTREFSGPARVIGPAGSGKTALLLHRALYEAERGPNARVLVICYNIALAHVLSSLLDRLCGSKKPKLRSHIEVRHLDAIASELCGRTHVSCEGTTKTNLLTKACNLAKPERLRLRFDTNLVKFVDRQITTWLKGAPGVTAETYQNIKFPPSHSALSSQERDEVLHIAEHYERLKGRSLDWEDLRSQALSKALDYWGYSFSNVTAVLVDEYQDFTGTGFKLIMALAKARDANVFFAGDERQRIYCPVSSFLQLGIDVRGRALRLDTNYRNTEQIARIARHLAHATEEEDGTPQSASTKFPALQGPRPLLAGLFSVEAEAEWVAMQAQKLVGEGYLPGEIGVLAPTWELQNVCAKSLREKGIPHFILKGETASRFFDEDAVKVSTYHQAKGLEYKVVFCAGLGNVSFQKEYRYSGTDGRATLNALLYMAVTRARDRLFLSFSGTPLRWLCNLGPLVDLDASADELILRGLYRLDPNEDGGSATDQQDLF